MSALKLPVAVFFLSLPFVAEGQITFGERIKLTNPVSRIQNAKVVDMDGDGDIDIVTIADYGPQADWWENDGSGNFTRHTWRPGKGPDQLPFEVADWNGDGRMDIWLTGYVYHEDTQKSGGYYLVAVGREDGSFEEPVAVTGEEENGASSDSIVADLDGNSHFDIIGGGRVHMAGPDGTFSGSKMLPDTLNGLTWFHRSRVRLHDYDGDGDLDAFLNGQYAPSAIRLFENQGEGNYSAGEVLVGLENDGRFYSFEILDAQDPGDHPSFLTITKKDSDEFERLSSYTLGTDGTLEKTGELELPGSDGDFLLDWQGLQRDISSAKIFVTAYASVDGVFTTRLSEVSSTEAGLAIQALNEFQDAAQLDFTSVQDLDGDGHADLAVPVGWSPGASQSARDHILWYPGDSSGNFAAEERAVVPPHYEASLLNLSDLDGDGDSDIVLGDLNPYSYENVPRSLTVWINDGDGTEFQKHPIPNNGFGMKLLAVDDQSQGDMRDLLVVNYLPKNAQNEDYKLIQTASKDTDGGYVLSPYVAFALASSTLHFLDWNNDGKKDIIVRDANGDIHWFERTQDRFLDPKLIMNLPGMEGFGRKTFSVIDMDRDGDPDFFATGNLFGENTNYWAERDGTGKILSVRQLPHELGLLGIDYDNDGYEDFIDSSGNIHLLRAGAVFEMVPSTFPLNPYYTTLNKGRLQDVDGDGDLDGIASLSTFGVAGFQRLSWQENVGSAVDYEFAPYVFVDGLEYASRDQFALGDLDGDGTKDLLVISEDTSIVEWFKITRRQEPAAFSNWMAGQGMTGSSAGPSGDWDGDSASNWEEFVFGTQAKVADLGSDGSPHLDMNSGGMEFTFQKRRSETGLDLVFTMQRSTRLDDWEPWTPEQPLPEVNGDYETVRIPVIPGEEAEFFRVRLPEIPE